MTKAEDKSKGFLRDNQDFHISVIVGRDKLQLMGEAAREGEADALRYSVAIGHWLKMIDEGEKYRCISCDVPFEYPENKADGFAICVAGRQYLVSGVCKTCAARGADYIQEVAMMKLQQASEPGKFLVRIDEDGEPEPTGKLQ